MDEMLKLIKAVNSYEIDEKSFKSVEWLSILFNRFLKLEYATTWIDSSLYTGADVRPMVFFRIENATLLYEQNILSSFSLYENFISKGSERGYNKKFLINQVANQREVLNRIAYLDTLYLSIDYFITQLSKIHNVNQTGQGKVQHFSKLLEHFNILDAGTLRNKITENLAGLLPDSMGSIKSSFTESSNSKLTYLKAFEYLTLIRNSLHNNGFANKSLPNLSIGPIKYKNIKKNESLDCMGLPNLILLIVQMIDVLEEICLLSIQEKPAEQVDPHLQVMKEHLGYYP